MRTQDSNCTIFTASALVAAILASGCGGDKTNGIHHGDGLPDGADLDVPASDVEGDLSPEEVDAPGEDVLIDASEVDDGDADAQDVVLDDLGEDVDAGDPTDVYEVPDPSLWTFNYRGIRIPVGTSCEEDEDCPDGRGVCDPLHKVCVECVAETDCGRHHICNVGTCIERPYGSYCLSNYDCDDPDKPVCRDFEHKGNDHAALVTDETAAAMTHPDSPRGFPYVSAIRHRRTGELVRMSARFCSPSQASCPDGEIPFPGGCKRLCALDLDCPSGQVCHGLGPISVAPTIGSQECVEHNYYGYCGLPSCMGTYAPVDADDPDRGWHEVEPPPRRCPTGTYCVAGNDCLAWPVHRVPNQREPVHFASGLLDACVEDEDCAEPELFCGRYNKPGGELAAGCVECSVDADCDGRGGVCDRTRGICGSCRPANDGQDAIACPLGYVCSEARQCLAAPCRGGPVSDEPWTCPVHMDLYGSLFRLNDDLSGTQVRSTFSLFGAGPDIIYCGVSDTRERNGRLTCWSRMDQRCVCTPYDADPLLEVCTPRERRPEDQ